MGDGPIQEQDFLFHPRADRPTEPNAGLIRYEPGASYPLHRHEFAQVWYVLEGELCCGGTTYGPGTFVYMPDPHFEVRRPVLVQFTTGV